MWTSFAAVTGGASAGLTGLVFIVVAFRFDTIAMSQELRSRAAQTLTLFITTTVIAALIVIPQATRILGGEMVAAALVSATVLTSLGAEARQVQTIPRKLPLVVGLPLFTVSVAASGLVLLFGFDWGMYLYAPGAVLAVVLGALGAWTYLTKAGVSPADPAPGASTS